MAAGRRRIEHIYELLYMGLHLKAEYWMLRGIALPMCDVGMCGRLGTCGRPSGRSARAQARHGEPHEACIRHGPQRCLAACCAPSGLLVQPPPVLMDLYAPGSPPYGVRSLRMTQAWVVANCMTALRTAVTLAMGAWYPRVARAGTPATNSCHLWTR